MDDFVTTGDGGEEAIGDAFCADGGVEIVACSLKQLSIVKLSKSVAIRSDLRNRVLRPRNTCRGYCPAWLAVFALGLRYTVLLRDGSKEEVILVRISLSHFKTLGTPRVFKRGPVPKRGIQEYTFFEHKR